MQNMKKIELWVGSFMLFGIVALVVVVFKIANVGGLSSANTYTLEANFDNIGGLKVRAPIKVGGVKIGEVTNITLDEETHIPRISMSLDSAFGYFPDSSTANIYTSGMLGEQYIGLIPGFELEGETEYMHDGDMIEDTNPALVLEDLIGKVLYSLTSSDDGGDSDESDVE